jgi:hypothetical protein
MRARVIFFRQLNCPEEQDPNRLLFLFSKAGISRKPKTRSWKRCKACHPFDNRARATGECRQISIPDKKRGNSIIGVCDLCVCAEQRDEMPTQISLRDRTDGRDTGLVARNKFLIDADNPALATDSKTTGYLALNWQSPKREARFTCRDVRFPTPPPQRRNNREIRALVTTSHLFWLNERRKRPSWLPIPLPNPHSLSDKRRAETEGGGGQLNTANRKRDL